MNRNEKIALLRHQLILNVTKLQQSISQLDYSHKKCSKFPDFEDLTPEELESFEAFCARFARTADILIQKVFTTIFFLLKEPQQTVIDKIHRAEKLGMAESADALLKIRDTCYEISHEYADTSLFPIFQDVLRLAPTLKKAAKKAIAFAKPLSKTLPKGA